MGVEQREDEKGERFGGVEKPLEWVGPAAPQAKKYPWKK